MAPTPLRWNGKDAQGNPLRWDTPGLTWNGNVPQPEGKHMQYLHVALGFSRAKDHTLEETVEAVINGMTSNHAAYPTPPVTMAALQTALTNFSAAIGAQQQGGTAATSAKNDKRDTLVDMLRQLAAYVQQTCNNDMTTLLTSGFSAVVNTHAQTALAQPTIANVDNGNSGQLLVTVGPLANAKCIEVRMAAIGVGGALGPWQSGGLFTYSRSMTVNGLTPGINYKVQVRAIGGSTGYSDWSDPVDHMSL